MTELIDLITATQSYLYSNQSPEANQLADPIGSTDTSMTLLWPPGTLTQRPALCSIELEIMRVWNVVGQVCSIERAVNGTVQASHALGSWPQGYLEVMPKFPMFTIMRAINNELDELSSPWNGLYSMQDIELTYNPAVSGYDMTDANTMVSVVPDNVIAIQEIRYKIPGPSKHLPAIRNFQIARNLPTADYPSGMAILLEGQGGFPGFPLHVRYRSRFSQFTSLYQDAQTYGLLPREANGIAPIGAAIELMAGREIKRNFTEATSDPLQLELVTGGQVLNSYKGLMLLRQSRIQAAAARLLRAYGNPLRVL
jgi:hypothetical protein